MMDFKYRKHPRLKDYDYSQPGYYYVTIHAEHNATRLSAVAKKEGASIELTMAGKIAEQQLYALEDRFSYVRIDKYVIMPTHIHAIIVLDSGECPRPGLVEIVRAYQECWRYIDENPAKWLLEPEDLYG